MTMGPEEALVRKTGKKETKRRYISKSHPKNRRDHVLNVIRVNPGHDALELQKMGLLQKSDASYLFLLEESGDIVFDPRPGGLGGWRVSFTEIFRSPGSDAR